MIGTPETTVFDLVRYSHNIGGIERVAETIAPLLPILKVKALHQVLDAEGEVATAQRLGFVLEAMGAATLAEMVHRWLPANPQKVQLSTYVVKDALALFNEKWSVFNNASCFQ